jgi:hypothetical protein
MARFEAIGGLDVDRISIDFAGTNLEWFASHWSISRPFVVAWKFHEISQNAEMQEAACRSKMGVEEL